MSKLHYLVYPAVVALSLAAAVAAHAETAAVDSTAAQAAPASVSQPKTRAQVRAETLQAIADRSIYGWSASNDPLALNAVKTPRRQAERPVLSGKPAQGNTQ